MGGGVQFTNMGNYKEGEIYCTQCVLQGGFGQCV